ncbi:MAG: hypothetical protein HN578_19565 [Rhodospirillales bacterium]|jgi:hypothetical protein|nr:hypothetical protein [Rhodospirillales bacterium]
MAHRFKENLKRTIASLLVAVLLVLNVISAAHAGTDSQLGVAGQFEYSLEMPKFSHAGQTHGNKSNQNNHTNGYECHQAPCQFFLASNKLHQENLSRVGLRFHKSQDQLTGILNAPLERPPKFIF